MMPSIREDTGTPISHHGQIQNEQIDPSPVSEPSFSWQSLQQPVIYGQEHFGTYSDVDNSSARPSTFARFPEAPSTREQDRWSYGAHAAIPYASSTDQLQISNTSRFNHGQPGSFYSDPSTLRPILPLPAAQSQLWTDSMTVNAINDEFISNTQALQECPYYAAHQTSPATYSTVSNRYSTLGAELNPEQRVFDEDNKPMHNGGTDQKSEDKGPCYATLIYQALMEAPGHKMVLRDIYAWIAQNTDKAKDPSSKGWQNSVRHNLSMNGDFLKVELVDPENESKKGFIWVLQPTAVKKGIQSTTRFRPKPGDKKNEHRDGGVLKSQRAGKRVGKAAKRSCSPRSSTGLDDAPYLHNTGAKSTLNSFSAPGQLTEPSMDMQDSSCLPYWIPTPPLSTLSSPPNESCYDFGDTPGYFEAQQNQSPSSITFGPDNEPMLEPNTSGVKHEDHFLGNGLDYFP